MARNARPNGVTVFRRTEYCKRLNAAESTQSQNGFRQNAQGTGVVLPAEIVFVAYLGVPHIDQPGDNFRRGHEAQALALCAERV
jgi:hypothetical protein